MLQEEIFSAAGLKRTRQREAVLLALSESDKPLTAEEIYEKTDNIAMSTIYRTIDRLLDKGLITKTTIPMNDGVFFELTMNEHKHYAICLLCRRMKYLDACPISKTDVDGFTVTAHRLELYGYCSECGKNM